MRIFGVVLETKIQLKFELNRRSPLVSRRCLLMPWWRASGEQRLVSSNLFPSAVMLALLFEHPIRQHREEFVRQKGGGGADGSGKKAGAAPAKRRRWQARCLMAETTAAPPIAAQRQHDECKDVGELPLYSVSTGSPVLPARTSGLPIRRVPPGLRTESLNLAHEKSPGRLQAASRSVGFPPEPSI